MKAVTQNTRTKARALTPNTGASLLVDEFSRRRQRNSMYSLRAFARDLGVSSTCLSDVMAKKRSLSRKNALQVSERLALTPGQTNLLLNQLGFRSDKSIESQEFFQLSEDAFKLVADWYYFAITALCKLPNIPADSHYLAERLGISEFEARSALERLLRLKILEVRRGKLVKTSATLSTTRDVPSSAIRSYHRQNLKLAEESLEKIAVDLREFSSITFPADQKRLPEVKELIMEFKRKIARIMETPTATEVYTFSAQLFPVTKDKGASQ